MLFRSRTVCPWRCSVVTRRIRRVRLSVGTAKSGVPPPHRPDARTAEPNSQTDRAPSQRHPPYHPPSPQNFVEIQCQPPLQHRRRAEDTPDRARHFPAGPTGPRRSPRREAAGQKLAGASIARKACMFLYTVYHRGSWVARDSLNFCAGFFSGGGLFPFPAICDTMPLTPVLRQIFR